jgi:hypothetical protein
MAQLLPALACQPVTHIKKNSERLNIPKMATTAPNQETPKANPTLQTSLSQKAVPL